ncbi:toll-like receptor 13 [Patella vulgata]|uniref:toll-like receptor 13 n=1 Tax=Patella vulgata TaxID=6465 RepID=UPI002180894F|nr:toll-like receptor 13 [Patella vulgata]
MLEGRKMLVVVILVLCWTSVACQDACSTGLCRCTAWAAHCIHTNLTYIPKFPPGITTIYFKYNSLPYIDPTTVLNISNTGVSDLFLNHNEIQYIDENVFQNLSRIDRLDLSYNLLTSDSLRNIFSSFQRNSRLTTITARHNRLADIPRDAFEDFKSSERITLDLSHNKIQLLNISSFSGIQNLHLLDVSFNNLSTLITGFNQHLQHIHISNNNLYDLPDFCKYGNSFPELIKMYLQYNRIVNIVPGYLNCLEKLEILDLEGNSIFLLKTNSFHSFKSLNWLSISKQTSSYPLFIQERAFNNSKIRYLNLLRNQLMTNRINEHSFDGCDGLEKLDLSQNNFFKDEDKLNVTIAPLKSLQILYIVGCRLQNIPNVVGKYFHNLTDLFVSYNQIKSWPNNLFEETINMKALDLSHNSIQTITSKMLPKMLRKGLKTISVAGNPLVCKCELVWLIRWIHREPHKFWDYPNDYRCLNITERICLNNTAAFISVTTVTCIFICVILIASVINKYIWHIKYHIYMWRYRPKQLLDIAEKHFAHDVFVAYCVEDGDWVLHDLLPIVEEGENIKLCIHERDFLGGQLIIDNIVQHMENSRKVLVVLSNDFARSKWCQFEMSLAQKLVIDRSIESIVVVLLEDIEAVNMSKSLNALLKTTTYIKWQDNENKEIVWQMVKTSLKRQYEL